MRPSLETDVADLRRPGELAEAGSVAPDDKDPTLAVPVAVAEMLEGDLAPLGDQEKLASVPVWRSSAYSRATGWSSSPLAEITRSSRARHDALVPIVAQVRDRRPIRKPLRAFALEGAANQDPPSAGFDVHDVDPPAAAGRRADTNATIAVI